MPQIDLVDETFVVAPAAVVAERLGDPALWRRWWPRLELAVFQDRGPAGIRWTVTGALVGTSEVWLEPVADGTLVHYYLRVDPARPSGGRRAARIARAHTWAFKRHINALKDELEAGRPPGVAPAAPLDGSVKSPRASADG